MSGISAAGIGSGLDLESLIKVSLEAVRAPQEARLQDRQKHLDVTLSAVGSVKSALGSFRDVLEGAQTANTFLPRMALVDGVIASRESSSSDEGDDSTISKTNYDGAYDISLSDEAANGVYDIEVLSVASGSRMATQSAYESKSSSISDFDSELTLSAGSGSDAQTFTIAITAGMSLSKLRDAINAAGDNFGVSANLINTGSGTHLTLDSSKAGDDSDTNTLDGNNNDLRLSASGTLVNPSLDDLVANLNITESASAAKISVNGIEATSDTNNFSNVISGISLDVNSLTSSSTKLEIKSDEDAAIDNVRGFVDTYNKVIGEIDKYTKPNQVMEGQGGDRKELSGDAMLRTLRFSLGKTGTIGYRDPDDSSRITTLYGIGIELQNDGTLVLNESKLREFANSDLNSLGQIFASKGGIVDSFLGTVRSYEESNGVLSSRETSVRSQLRELAEDKLSLKERLQQQEDTLRSKFTAFDQTMGQLNSQMSYIQGQLG
jgi:flagellar hook-associated protein 2